MKSVNASLSEGLNTLKVKKSDEETNVLRNEVAAQKKKIEDMMIEGKKLSKEINAKEQSLKVIKDELAETQKSSNSYKRSGQIYKGFYESYKSDNEELRKIILEKDEEINKLKEALEEAKMNQAASSFKRKQKNEINTKSKRNKTEDLPPVSDSTEIPNTSFPKYEPTPGSLITFIDSFSATLSSARDDGPSGVHQEKCSDKILSKSTPTIDDLARKESLEKDVGQELPETEENDENITTTEEGNPDNESSFRTPSYSPAKTSMVDSVPVEKQLIKIRNIGPLLQDEGEEETRASVKRIDFDRIEDTQDRNPTWKYNKMYLIKKVKAIVEKCVKGILSQNKTILSEEEYNDLATMFVQDFTEKIISNHLQSHTTEKGVALSNRDKNYIIDHIILYFTLKKKIHEYITPLELKVKLKLKLNQKDFVDLEKKLFNKLFSLICDTSQEDVISNFPIFQMKFDKLDKYYDLGHVLLNPEKNKISREWLIKRFVDHSLGEMGFNVTVTTVTM